MSLTEHTACQISAREFTESKRCFCFFAKMRKKIKAIFSVCSSSVASVNSVRDTPASAAFSLLEVLVAMTVLVVIILMVTNMFRNTSEAWDTGTQSAEMNTSARAAMEYISRELSCAVAGSIPNSAGGVARVKEFTLVGGKLLSFTALPTYTNRLCGIRFGFDNNEYRIQYKRLTDAFYPYQQGWGGIALPGYLLITNVWSFQATVCSNESDMLNGHVGSAYDSSLNTNMLPACVDIAITMLSERDMTRALSLKDAGQPYEGFVMTNSRVYTTRVCFPNRGRIGE